MGDHRRRGQVTDRAAEQPPGQQSTEQAADDLSDHVPGYRGPAELAPQRQPDRDPGIEAAAARADDPDRRGEGPGPAEGDRQPAGARGAPRARGEEYREP